MIIVKAIAMVVTVVIATVIVRAIFIVIAINIAVILAKYLVNKNKWMKLDPVHLYFT